MTDHETRPAGTVDLVKRLREDAKNERIHAFEQDFWHEEILIEAADRIEQLDAALTRANAATAAAYEVAARECDYYAKSWDDLNINGSSISVIAYAIRALATADHTAALDRLIAEAVKPYVEALAWYGEQARLARLIHSEGDAGRNALQADGGKRAAAILATSKKGGV